MFQSQFGVVHETVQLSASLDLIGNKGGQNVGQTHLKSAAQSSTAIGL